MSSTDTITGIVSLRGQRILVTQAREFMGPVLCSVLAEAGPVDATLVLGDLVGYGADPNAVIDRVQAIPSMTVIRGNHDKVGAGIESVRSFNHLARYAIEWTTEPTTVPGNPPSRMSLVPPAPSPK